MSYKLSQQLKPAHLQDVKAVLAINDNTLASASRDGSVAIWKKDVGKFALKALLRGHDAYVNSLAHVMEDNTILSGGNSSLILAHSLDSLSPESVAALTGHQLNVCVLRYKDETLISGSWDMTARVWTKEGKEWGCRGVLEAHNAAVWGVDIVPAVEEGNHVRYLTGSADKTIRLWSHTFDCVGVFKSSPEPVRSLSLLSDGSHFYSACNDGRIRVWDLSGRVMGTFSGHPDYAYEVVATPEGAVSCGEDHTVRVWSERGEQLDVMLHPCQTVWAVCPLPDGDLASAGSDGVVRVWTRDSQRVAGAEQVRAYDAAVEGVKQKVAAATACEAGQEKVKGARDVVVDVDISDDSPPLQLRFQSEEHPRDVAVAFVRDHALPESYVDQIEAFIGASV
ncbi:Sir2 histone deacetylase Hst2 [Cryptotrichosporon argae]